MKPSQKYLRGISTHTPEKNSFLHACTFQIYLNNLTTNKVYDLKVQAGTRSQVGERLMHFGPFSQVQRVLLQPGCEAMRTFAQRSTEQNHSVILINLEEHLGTIAGAVCGTLGLLLAIFAFLLWR